MLVNPFTILALLSVAAEAVPFHPQSGSLQQSRRRLIDYPVQHDVPARAFRKRTVPYSVVQVDGGSQTTTVTSELPEQTTLLTTVTLPATTATSVLTCTETTSVVGSSMPSVTSEPSVTVFHTVTDTTTATVSTSTPSMYDDGMWHTYYPVKTWSSTWSSATPAPVAATVATPVPAVTAPVASSSPLWKRRSAAEIPVPADDLTRTNKRGIFKQRR